MPPGAPTVGKRTTTCPVLSLLGSALGVTQQQDGLGLLNVSPRSPSVVLGGCCCWAVIWGAGEGTGSRLQHGTASYLELLPFSAFPNPLGLLKCATCRSLKGLFLCLDHKIAKEQWLSFKTAALELFPTSYCYCHCCSTSKHQGAPGEERGEPTLRFQGSRGASLLAETFNDKEGVLHPDPWGDCPGLGPERKEAGRATGVGHPPVFLCVGWAHPD